MRIEGRNAVREALRSGMKVERALMLKGIKPGGGIQEIQDLLGQQGLKVEYVQRRDLDNVSEYDAHQGVIVWVAPFEYASLGELIKKASASAPSLIIVLDHITDPGNLGAIARSAEVAGASGIVVAKDRAAAITPAAHKAAAGALAYLPVVQVTNITRVIQQLKEAGFWVAGASEHAEQLVWDAPLSGNIALVMGSEGSGLSRLVREQCDFLVKLPQVGKVSSLNVAQAATAITYEYLRQNR